jgi:hypothetical protein
MCCLEDRWRGALNNPRISRSGGLLTNCCSTILDSYSPALSICQVLPRSVEALNLRTQVVPEGRKLYIFMRLDLFSEGKSK